MQLLVGVTQRALQLKTYTLTNEERHSSVSRIIGRLWNAVHQMYLVVLVILAACREAHQAQKSNQ
jgi:hypothetical protein